MKINHKEVTIVTICPFCGHANEVAVNEADYWDWQDGALVQDAFPYLTADEREMLISGICLTCQREVFVEDDCLYDWDDDWDCGEDDCDYEAGFDPYMGCFTDEC